MTVWVVLRIPSGELLAVCDRLSEARRVVSVFAVGSVAARPVRCGAVLVCPRCGCDYSVTDDVETGIARCGVCEWSIQGPPRQTWLSFMRGIETGG